MMMAAPPPPLLPAATCAATHAAPEGGAGHHVGEQGDRADEDADEQAEADVVVRHVGQLVADDALELLAVELLEKPRRDGHAGVLRVATRGEGVGRGVVDEVDACGSGTFAARLISRTTLTSCGASCSVTWRAREAVSTRLSPL